MILSEKRNASIRAGAAATVVACVSVLSGCVDDDASPETQAEQPLMLNFKAVIGDEDFLCGKTYENVGLGKHDYRAEGLRMYVSGLKATLDNGNEVKASLIEDGVWQHDNVALLDFGTNCSEGEEHEMNMQIHSEVLLYSTREVTGVCFDVGIPFDRNHQGVAGALPPLDATQMFNSVKDGRTFLRLDGTASADDKPQAFHVQLKSTGCISDDKDRRPSLACGSPNMAKICMSLNPTTQAIAFDVKPLLGGVDISKNKDADPGCYSAKNDSECTTILPALGIDFEFIEPEKDASSFVSEGQKVFKVVNVD